MTKNKKYLLIELIIFISVIAVDMLTKYLLDGKVIPIIKGVISFTSSHNTGAAFSIFSNNTLMLIIVTIIFLGIIFIADRFIKNKNMLYFVSFALIIAGGVGNLIDRIFLGYVRDFIYFELINFAIFNVADSALTIGVILFAIFVIFFSDGKKNKKQTKLNGDAIIKKETSLDMNEEINVIDNTSENNSKDKKLENDIIDKNNKK